MPVPATPAAPICTSLNGSVRLNWVAPNNGGSVITDYAIQRKTSGQADTSYTLVLESVSAALTYTAPSLTNGVSYVFRIAAKNSIGWSQYSEGSLPVTPSNIPGTMIVPTVISGNNSVTLNWTAPANNGAIITDYNIQRKVVGQPDTTYVNVIDGVSTATTYTNTGLANGGTGYRFRIRAVNIKGPGGWSVASIPVIPSSVPNAPTNLSVISGVNQVTLNWTAPANNGAIITDYIIQIKTDTQPDSSFVNAADTVKSTTGAVIRGLINGNGYVFRVAAINVKGRGSFSANSIAVVPSNVPAQCTAPICTRGFNSVVLNWTAPANNGATITDYIIQRKLNGQPDTTYVTINDGVSSNTTYTNRGLTNGVGYRFRIAARNIKGNGAYSAASAVVIPGATIPNAPTNLTATIVNNTGVSLSWTLPTDTGGVQITSYIVQSKPVDRGSPYAPYTWRTVSNNYAQGSILNGFDDLQTNFRVAAVNVAGVGPYSNISNTVTPSNRLFDKSSWRDSVSEPYLSYLNKAADRWNRYIRYNATNRSNIAAISQFSGWNGLRLEPGNYTLFNDSTTGTIAACGVYWAYHIGTAQRWNSISFTLEINDHYRSGPNAITENQWIDAMTHELGHALGIGTFWQSGYTGSTPPTNFFLNGTTYSNGQAAYNSITGLTRSLMPLENSGGAGTASGHWENNFRAASAIGGLGVSYPGVTNELMIGTIFSNGMILSPLSIKTLVDFGWEEINVNASEGNPTLALSISARILKSTDLVKCGKLRNKVTPMVIDSDGNITTIPLELDPTLEADIKLAPVKVKPKSHPRPALHPEIRKR